MFQFGIIARSEIFIFCGRTVCMLGVQRKLVYNDPDFDKIIDFARHVWTFIYIGFVYVQI